MSRTLRPQSMVTARPSPGLSMDVDSVCRKYQPQPPPPEEHSLRLFHYGDFLLRLASLPHSAVYGNPFLTHRYIIIPPPHSNVYATVSPSLFFSCMQ